MFPIPEATYKRPEFEWDSREYRNKRLCYWPPVIDLKGDVKWLSTPNNFSDILADPYFIFKGQRMEESMLELKGYDTWELSNPN